MKKSVEILGLPIISITEGRELGVSKTLLIDAKNGAVAAITIEDDDWYRGVKLIPYESIIAIGEDAVTITHSENILTLDEAGDYERLLDENIRVIGTKAITRTGRIQGKVTEVFIGEGGKIEKCEITTPDGLINEVGSDQISIFGKQVTVVDVDGEKKNNLTEQPAFEPFKEEPAQEPWTPSVEELKHELPPPEDNTTSPEEQAALEEVMTPEPVEEVAPVVEEPTEEVTPAVEESTEEVAPVVDEPVEEVAPVVEEPAQEVAPVVDEPAEEVAPVVDEPAEEVAPVVDEPAQEVAPVVDEPAQEVAPVVDEPVEEVAPVVDEPAEEVAPVVDEPVEEVAPVVDEPVEEKPSEEDKKIAAMTQQAEDLKAALQKARASQQNTPSESTPMVSQRKQVEKAVDERRRRVLLGKHATKTIMTDNGTLVVESGAEVTEEVLQRARLSNKFIELSMNVK